MNKILGLDLGVASIGWAYIQEKDEDKKIIGLGSRIIPLDTDEKNEFSAGNSISKNQKRTTRRTQRKGYDRYQLRRRNLTNFLVQNRMFDPSLFKLTPHELWGLRAKAVEERIELLHLGRILYHLNQKRGYKSSRSDANLGKKDTEYVAEVKNRYQELKESGMTIGQKFYKELLQDQHYRIKRQVYPREAYVEEFDAILHEQKKHYSEILSNENISILRNEIIYYQRKLKSQKGLVNVCEFERFDTKSKDGKAIISGPKVAHKSSPLFQICKIWESINSITLQNKQGATYTISIEQKKALFHHLDHYEKLNQSDLLRILGLARGDGWYTNKQIERGIQGNIIKCQISSAIKSTSNKDFLLRFKLDTVEEPEDVFLIDRKSGEIIGNCIKKTISTAIEKEPLYRLWHTIYSISDVPECIKTIMRQFDLDETTATTLAKLDFSRLGFGNKSAKSMRKILPYLMEGYVYSDACSLAGYNHSNYLTKDENAQRVLLDKLPLLRKNNLRQPVVEKILNQMIQVVNDIITTFGKPDEIRIELARELKQSKDERNNTFSELKRRERESEAIRNRLISEYGIRATRNNVIKWRLFHEINNHESKLNALCVYCGNPFGITDALKGNHVDIEHIIPKALLFDDSQSNKTLSHRHCNEAKGKLTAYDYMRNKSGGEFEAYIERVNELYTSKIIGKAKRDKLLMPTEKIPTDFIDRQLRESQYIAKKSRELLHQVCRNVWSTSGSITEYLRRIWGWDDVLMNLQLPQYRDLGLTEWKEWETQNGQIHKREVITHWSKRDDHRHHAIDALVIACSQQGFIHRINNLSAKGMRDQMYVETGPNRNGNLLESYLFAHRPFSTKEVEIVAAGILISYKSGKKVASWGTRKIKKEGRKKVVQKNILIPRGALSEESVYGRIKTISPQKPIKYLFEHPDLIINLDIHLKIQERLGLYQNNAIKALSSIKKSPIFLDAEKNIRLEHADCFQHEYVLKYPIEAITSKDLPYIIDEGIRRIVRHRLEEYTNKEKEAFKKPLYFDKECKNQIKSIRLKTGLTAVEPVKQNEQGEDIGFVKPGNNHHIALYTDASGKIVEQLCSFWHAVDRKKYGIPVVIKHPSQVWNKILSENKDLPDAFLAKLPGDHLTFKESLQQNEMFILGMSMEDFYIALRDQQSDVLSKYLYRVQSISSSDYYFRHHLETELIETPESKVARRYYRFKSIKSFLAMHPIKVRVTRLGSIIINQNYLDYSFSDPAQINVIHEPYARIDLAKKISISKSFEDDKDAQLKYWAALSPVLCFQEYYTLIHRFFAFKPPAWSAHKIVLDT